jgi:catecholate siderophore receptor
MDSKTAARQPGGLGAAAMLALCMGGPTLAQTATGRTDATADPKADLKAPTVQIHGRVRSDTDTYQSGLTTTGKVALPARDIPQSLTTVTGALMRDRGADTMKDALRNVAGLTFNAGEGGRIGDNITLRGYSAVGDLYLDNMRDVAQYNRETFNLDRIEVLRGSASMLYGRGSTGGLINQVSKTPFLADRGTTSLTLGSYGYKRLLADVNKQVGETTALRINAMKTDANSFRDGVTQDRWGIAPSVTFGLGTPDEVTFSYYRLQESNVPDFGVPYFNGRPLNVPTNRFFGIANADYDRNDTGIVTASHTHRFNAETNLRTVLRHADYERDLRAVAPRLAAGTTFIADNTVVNRQRQARGSTEQTLTLQSDFTTKFEAAGMKHLALAGVELVRERAHRWTNTGSVPNPSTTVGNPDAYPVLPAGYYAVTRTADNFYTAHTIGLYAQDVVEFVPSWKAVVGARFDRFSAEYDRPAPAGNLSRTDSVLSTRVGLLYQPDDDVSYYASYGTSFNPSAELYALDDRGANTPPEKSRNLEAGVKWELYGGDLSLRTAVFRSQKTNERNTDLAVTVEQNLLSGRRHTDGVEVEAAGRITPNWEVFSALAVMRANIDAATGQQANTLDRIPLNTPNYTFNLWSVYRLGDWRLGGGVEGAGLRYANNTNTNATPRYARWDAMVAYEQRSYTIRMNLYNVFDKDYYEGVYAGHSVPGLARTARITAELKF